MLECGADSLRLLDHGPTEAASDQPDRKHHLLSEDGCVHRRHSIGAHLDTRDQQKSSDEDRSGREQTEDGDPPRNQPGRVPSNDSEFCCRTLGAASEHSELPSSPPRTAAIPC